MLRRQVTEDQKKKKESFPQHRKGKVARLPQHLRLMPLPATATAERRLIAAVDALLAQLAKQEVLYQIEGKHHAPTES